jgi:hypothetical protein
MQQSRPIPEKDQVVVLDRSGDGYISSDGGVNWQSVTHSATVGNGDPPWLKTADQPFFLITDLRFDPAVPNRLWTGHGMGVFYADVAADGGHLNWVSQTRGIEELVAYDVVQPPGYAPVFAGLDFGIHVKGDLNAFSTEFGPKRNFIAAQQLDWTPAEAGFVITNASDTRLSCCSGDGNAVMAGTSRNGGRSWSKFATLPTPPGTKVDDPWKMSFGTIAVSSSDADNIVWQPAFNRQPYYTKNGGRSWQPVMLSGAVGDQPGSFPSIWPQRKTLAADKSAPNTFYLVHSGEGLNGPLQGLWRSTDGGDSWSRVYEGEIAPASGFAAKLRSVPGHAGHLFFTSASSASSDRTLRRSTDGGVTWSHVPEVTGVDDIAFGKRHAAGPTLRSSWLERCVVFTVSGDLLMARPAGSSSWTSPSAHSTTSRSWEPTLTYSAESISAMVVQGGYGVNLHRVSPPAIARSKPRIARQYADCGASGKLIGPRADLGTSETI